MSDTKKIILWFLICFVLAIYVKTSELSKVSFNQGSIFPNSGSVLGEKTSHQTFGDLLKKSP